ncbi:hypothetical protein NPIL_141531 [Nephila pilipes]|uniref:Uncharacterized protein n=1 Tax=Nephila pilipes TaxID=299642 RepID=A0A8X6TNY8_NEPPI|nr:hypothetical protein NPIL_141531 [Nephila pilipes]
MYSRVSFIRHSVLSGPPQQKTATKRINQQQESQIESASLVQFLLLPILQQQISNHGSGIPVLQYDSRVCHSSSLIPSLPLLGVVQFIIVCLLEFHITME